MRLGLKLVAASGSQAVTVPAGRTLVVGRSPACDVPIRDLTVSRHHGEIEADAAGLRIRDLGSTNGTFINGSRISDGLAAPGARVAFGKVAFQVMEERIPSAAPGAADDSDGEHLAIVSQMRAHSSTDIAALLAPEQAAAPDGPRLRVRGHTPAERRTAALALLLEFAKELSQQGEPARLLDKTARLALQAMHVDRVDILTPGDGDEMVPRVSKVRPGGAAGDGHVPRTATRKAVVERVAVLIAETAPKDGTHALRHLGADPAAPAQAASEAGTPPASEAEPPAAHRPALLATTDAVQVAAENARVAEIAGGLAASPGSPGSAGPSSSSLGSQGAYPGSEEPLAGAHGSLASAGSPGSFGALRSSGSHQTAGGALASPDKTPSSDPARGSAICAPLLGMQATVLGLIYVVAAEARSLGREDLEFLTAFAGIVAVTLENLRLMERARDEAVAQAGHQRHFGPFVAERIAGQDGGAGLAAARRRVAFLCCEIRGFTSLAEQLEPEEVAILLGEFFGEMVDLVFEHGGTLDKLTGVGLTALWGAPLSRQDDADEAVQAAIGMQRGLERLNGEWSRQDRHQLAISIGIDLGQVFAGNVGSERRLDFTAIGRPVERSCELCAGAAAGEILVTEALLEALASPPPVDAIPPTSETPAKPATVSIPTGSETSRPAYRIDWRTPPTLRQSGEMSQV